MPKSTIKTKLNNKYSVRFRVVGSLDELTPDQLKSLALRYVRNAARAIVVAELNSAEPAVVTNRRITDSMKTMMNIPEDTIRAFCAAQDPPMYLDIPTEFSIPLKDLIPSEEATRGKKAANIFEFGSEDEPEEDEDEEEVVTTPTV
jgi:hypothetical protein